MDRAKIGARAQTKQREKEMRGFLSQFLCTQNVGTLTTRSRSEGKGGEGEGGRGGRGRREVCSHPGALY